MPAFVAAELGAAQALGLVEVERDRRPACGAVRRLDGGRREVLVLTAPAVLSVEGSVARLRRASLAPSWPPGPRRSRSDGARRGRWSNRGRSSPTGPGPGRWRCRRATRSARVRALTVLGAVATGAGEVVVLDPPAAAARILDALRAWGYVDAIVAA